MKLHYIEASLSLFVVGLGQIIKGEGNKGLLLILTFYLTLPAIVLLSLLLVGNSFPYVLGFVIIFAIILWLYSIADALLR
ncbi:hypothetical protein A3H38_06525 [candidate division WOR-1 bacterium RIFCSPLOWO2_02_FULL_46_20]|uniref:Uncharacterized protein n=2 Tax=Saganbacteria TaxID=1703751 RepID=A0A1F4RCC7_UNCSA|nr:MAG: hypothetical protein A3J44_03420 [candidate division WOR-1 bacterium RIFCSPHIGHO2_02_FULL_45_12]OGC05841.1 MAG: hypothetical protein A3H38_06525 [candidate division WOR-1 bacterium RIFCSPLOWO2_02_FULL_46_20]OGC09120.1 MAG: hypothetical protein A3F86_01425 [candidate division WOR-1 bacterium RIFCSPLOWO2_12_FULL_45_9]